MSDRGKAPTRARARWIDRGAGGSASSPCCLQIDQEARPHASGSTLGQWSKSARMLSSLPPDPRSRGHRLHASKEIKRASERERETLRVSPLGPMSRWRRLTKRSLLRTKPPILMISHAISSSVMILAACGNGTLRASSRIKSRACQPTERSISDTAAPTTTTTTTHLHDGVRVPTGVIGGQSDTELLVSMR